MFKKTKQNQNKTKQETKHNLGHSAELHSHDEASNNIIIVCVCVSVLIDFFAVGMIAFLNQ